MSPVTHLVKFLGYIIELSSRVLEDQKDIFFSCVKNKLEGKYSSVKGLEDHRLLGVSDRLMICKMNYAWIGSILEKA